MHTAKIFLIPWFGKNKRKWFCFTSLNSNYWIKETRKNPISIFCIEIKACENRNKLAGLPHYWSFTSKKGEREFWQHKTQTKYIIANDLNYYVQPAPWVFLFFSYFKSWRDQGIWVKKIELVKSQISFSHQVCLKSEKTYFLMYHKKTLILNKWKT